MKNSTIVKVENLYKIFRTETGGFLSKKVTVETKALNRVNLEIESGEFVALLGPNGAGKSTLIKILIGVMAYQKGTVEVMGMEPLNNRANIISRLGVVFGQRSRMWWDLPVAESFELTKRLYIDNYPQLKDAKRLEWENFLIDNIDIRGLLQRQVKKLSLGEKMRCELVNTLLYNPDLIFLDEPTIGLDVISKQKIREALKILNREGKTILLTSHDTGDIEKLCDRVVVINHGEVAVDLSMAKFMKLNNDIEVIFKLKEKIKKTDLNIFEDLKIKVDVKNDFQINVIGDRKRLSEIIRRSFAKLEIADVDFASEKVENILIEIYGRK